MHFYFHCLFHSNERCMLLSILHNIHHELLDRTNSLLLQNIANLQFTFGCKWQDQHQEPENPLRTVNKKIQQILSLSVFVFLYLSSIKQLPINRQKFSCHLTLLWRRPLSYRNHSIDLRSKSMDWFLYDNGLRRERVNTSSLVVFLF